MKTLNEFFEVEDRVKFTFNNEKRNKQIYYIANNELWSICGEFAGVIQHIDTYVLFGGITLYKEPILTEEERDYLNAVIKPVKDKVVRFCKDTWTTEPKTEQVYIYLNDGHIFTTYPFKAGTEYKGMEKERNYTPEELGLEV